MQHCIDFPCTLYDYAKQFAADYNSTYLKKKVEENDNFPEAVFENARVVEFFCLIGVRRSTCKRGLQAETYCKTRKGTPARTMASFI